MYRRIRNYWAKDLILEAKSIFSVFWVSLILLSFFILLGYIYYLSKFSTPSAYKGKVLDKWVSVFESQQGSSIRGKLLIEAEDGSKLEIPVDSQIYERVEIGNYIVSHGNSVVVSPDK